MPNNDKHDDQTLQNICRHCGHQNRPGVLMCTACGHMLVAGGESKTKRLNPDEMDQIESNPGLAVDVLAPFTENMKLALHIKEIKDPLVFDVDERLVIGRFDKRTGVKPDVDMYPFAGYLLGVSRKHAIISRVDNKLMIEDLNSSNGTYVNGEKLPPKGSCLLPDGAVVRLGDLHFTVSYVE